MESFADDVAWMCDRLGIEKPVMIGHSMGGIVAFDLACRYPTLPSAIVMLDAAAVLPGGSRAASPHLIEGLLGADYQEVQRQYVASSLGRVDLKEGRIGPAHRELTGMLPRQRIRSVYVTP